MYDGSADSILQIKTLAPRICEQRKRGEKKNKERNKRKSGKRNVIGIKGVEVLVITRVRKCKNVPSHLPARRLAVM